MCPSKKITKFDQEVRHAKLEMVVLPPHEELEIKIEFYQSSMEHYRHMSVL